MAAHGTAGSRDQMLLAVVPGGGPNSLVSVMVTTGATVERATFEVPPPEQFQPISFD